MRVTLLVSCVAAFLIVVVAAAQADPGGPTQWPSMMMTYAPVQAAGQAATKPATAPPKDKEKAAPAAAPASAEKKAASEYGYHGVSPFFNVVEAYSELAKGVWEFGAGARWSTADGVHDDVGMSQYIAYGITDDVFAALSVDEPLGYSGDGVGEARLTLFANFWHETDVIPAFGGY